MMPVYSRALFGFLFLLAMVSGARAGDLKVVSVIRFQNGDPYTQTRYYKGERARIESRGHTSWKPGLVTYGPPWAMVFQCDAQRAIVLNLETHKYTVSQPKDACRHTAPALPAPKGTIDVYIESTDTGERREILGRTARHIITRQRQVAGPGACWRDAEMEWDGWYIEMEEQEVDRRLRRNTVDELAHVMMSGAHCRDKIVVHRKGVERPGLGLRVVYVSRLSVPGTGGASKELTNRWESEVTELSEAPLDAALFDVPAGFTKVSEIDTQPPMPLSVAIENWWQRRVNTVNEIGSWF
jgi:hypothetical protein